MADETLTVRFSGQADLTRRLHVMAENVGDLRPVWDVLRERFVAMERRTFARQGGTSGRWAPLSPSYGAWKARHYGGQPILQRTGRLAASLTSDLSIDIREPHMMLLGSDSTYGGYHQTGTRKMPRRRVIDLSETERRLWVRKIRDHIMDADDTAAALGKAGWAA